MEEEALVRDFSHLKDKNPDGTIKMYRIIAEVFGDEGIFYETVGSFNNTKDIKEYLTPDEKKEILETYGGYKVSLFISRVGKAYSKDELKELIDNVPRDIKKEIENWILCPYCKRWLHLDVDYHIKCPACGTSINDYDMRIVNDII